MSEVFRLHTSDFRLSACVCLVVLSLPVTLTAQDVPVDITVRTFFKPEGQTLRALVRMPLEAVRIADYPKRPSGAVDLTRIDPTLEEAARVWVADNLELYEGGARLSARRIASVRASYLGDPSFESYDSALVHVLGPKLPDEAMLFWNQGLLDVLIEYAIASDRSAFAMHATFARLAANMTTAVRFLPPDGDVRSFEYRGDPGAIDFDPRWTQTAARFAALGFRHVFDGTGSLWFLACLILPIRTWRPLTATVAAFTAVHSLTLLWMAWSRSGDSLWFPAFIDAAIAAAIVYLAFENMLGTVHALRRIAAAAVFGVVYGCSFWFEVRPELQFGGSHAPAALLSFNAGVELGQLLVVLLLISALGLLFRFVVAERIGSIIVSALAAHTAWHWMIDRGDRLRQFAFPAFDAATAASLTRALMAVVFVIGVVWLITFARRSRIPNS